MILAVFMHAQHKSMWLSCSPVLSTPFANPMHHHNTSKCRLLLKVCSRSKLTYADSLPPTTSTRIESARFVKARAQAQKGLSHLLPAST